MSGLSGLPAGLPPAAPAAPAGPAPAGPAPGPNAAVFASVKNIISESDLTLNVREIFTKIVDFLATVKKQEVQPAGPPPASPSGGVPAFGPPHVPPQGGGSRPKSAKSAAKKSKSKK